MPLLPTPNYTLIDTATAIPQLPCKDSSFDYTPNFILCNIDPIFMLIIGILYFLLILDIVREVRTLRKQSAALQQASMNEEKAAMGTTTRYRPGKEPSEWQPSADEFSDVEAKYFSFGQALMDEEKAAMGTPIRYRPRNGFSDWHTSADEVRDAEARYLTNKYGRYVPSFEDERIIRAWDPISGYGEAGARSSAGFGGVRSRGNALPIYCEVRGKECRWLQGL